MLLGGDAGRLNDFMRQIIEDGQFKSSEDRSILNKHSLHILVVGRMGCGEGVSGWVVSDCIDD